MWRDPIDADAEPDAEPDAGLHADEHDRDQHDRDQQGPATVPDRNGD
jgi:hypothetical protein